jgi:hypothetical protein
MQARKTRYLHMRLDEAEMHDLIARCHADRVTVTDAMMAAYAKAVAGSEPSPARFVLAVPHNIRDSVKPPISSGDMGAFVVEIPVECDSAQCGDADFWTLAAALGHGLREALPAAMAADPDYDMEMLGQAVDGIVDPQRPAFANAVLSNLGVPAIGEGSDGLAVDRLYIGVSMHAGANAFFITAATIGGALDISLGACHSLILPAAHRAVSERFMQCLKTA